MIWSDINDTCARRKVTPSNVCGSSEEENCWLESMVRRHRPDG